MNSAASNIDKKSIKTLIYNVIQKDGIFNKKTTQGFDSLYIKSKNKLTSAMNVDKPVDVVDKPVDVVDKPVNVVDKPVNVETPKKNIKISSSKTTNLDKYTPICDIFTETPALKENLSFKLNSDISKNVPKSSDSSTLPDTREANNSVRDVSHVTH